MRKPTGRVATLGFVLTLVLLAGNGFLALASLGRVARNERRVAHTHEVLAALESTLATLTDAETGQRGYLLTGDDRYLAPYTDAVKRVGAEVENLRDLTRDSPEQQARIPLLAEKIDVKRRELARTIALRKEQGFDAARQVVLTGAGKAAMDDIRQVVADMEESENALLRLRQKESKSSLNGAILTVLVATVVAVALVGVAYSLLRRDLAERARAAAALDEQREWLEVTLTSIGDAVIATDTAGRVAFLNPVAEALTGWPRAEAVGAPLDTVFAIVNEKSRAPVESPVARVLREGAVVGLANHTVLLGRDGRETPIADSAAPIWGAGGAPVGVVLVFRDVTAQREAEAARQEADRRKDEFLALLGHELRNPLAPIRTALHLLAVPGADAAVVARARDVLERQVGHLVRLVDDLLDVSRIMRGKIELRKEPVELAEVVARAVEAAQPAIDARGQELTVALPPEPVLLNADPVRLAQVVGNLLNNSAKFTPGAGRIALTAAREAEDVVLRVRDTGVGIPVDMLERVFEPFVQGERSLDRAQGGLGIGLTLVRRLVELHGGRVEAHSAGPGQGSEFVVRLPAPPGGGAGPVGRDAEAGAAAPRRRVLVVDDNVDAAESLAVVLRLAGHDVRVAHDGPAALEAARAARPDVVLLDLGMPVMDGYEVARRLRREPGLEGVRLVALTGWGQEEDRHRTRAAGFDDHLVKPVELGAVQAVLAGAGEPA